MNQQLQKKKRRIILRKTPPDRVLEEISKGNKFIVLEDDIDNVPEGYILVNMKYKGSSLKTLVPQQLMFFLANPGEGSIDDALDEVSDFYGEVEDFEDDAIEEGRTNVQDVNWATTSREAYQTYLINKLTGDGREFKPSVLEELCLNDPYVEQRVKGIAALVLGKSAEEIKKAKLTDLLEHVTVGTEKKEVREKLTREELEKVRCYAGSHYELKSEYRNLPDVKYEISRLDEGGGTKTYEKIHEIKTSVVNKRIHQLEEEIEDHRLKKKKEIGRHDNALTRQYINLAYISKENPEAQLDIQPHSKDGGKKNE